MEHPPSKERGPSQNESSEVAPMPPPVHAESSKTDKEAIAALRARLNGQAVLNQAGQQSQGGGGHAHAHHGPSIYRKFIGFFGVLFSDIWSGIKESAGSGFGGSAPKKASSGGGGHGGHH